MGDVYVIFSHLDVEAQRLERFRELGVHGGVQRPASHRGGGGACCSRSEVPSEWRRRLGESTQKRTARRRGEWTVNTERCAGYKSSSHSRVCLRQRVRKHRAARRSDVAAAHHKSHNVTSSNLFHVCFSSSHTHLCAPLRRTWERVRASL